MSFVGCALGLALFGIARPASSAIAYVQGAAQDPSSASAVSVTYASAQSATDLNVLIVGWSDSSASVTSITDTKGNTYALATGPTSIGPDGSQAIYYAANIATASAGANSVTVTFSENVNYPDVRILEYSGVSTTSPLDGGIGAGGTGTSLSSGSITTTNANDLLVGGDLIGAGFAAVGSGYTQRLVTSPDGNLAEDQVVTSTGTYSATATQTPSSWWVIQLAAFKAAGSSPAPVAYVQGTYATPTSASSVALAYPSAQSAGDLNVICLGWNSASSSVSSVTDSKGNTYVAAVSATISTGNATALIYYAKNIVAASAGANTVTVTFASSVPYPDVRIVEYSGISTTNPFDVGIGASGSGTTQNSGALTTTNANDLLVASTMIASNFVAVGSGYTLRVDSSPDDDIVEDQIVTATGSFSATATQTASAWWVMQQAAFRAAASSSSSSSSSSGGSSSSGSSSSGSTSGSSSSGSSSSSSSGSSSGSTSSSGSGGGSGSSGSSGSGGSYTYVYDSTAHLTDVKTATGTVVAHYVYDAAGHLLTVQTTP